MAQLVLPACQTRSLQIRVFCAPPPTWRQTQMLGHACASDRQLHVHASHGVLPVADAILEEPRLAEICDSPDPDRSDLDAYAALADEFSAGTVLDVVEKGISTRTNGVTAGSLPTCRAWPPGPPRPGRNGRRGHADPARDCPPEGEHCRHRPRRAVRDPPHHARRQGSTQPSRTRAVLSPDGPRPSSVRTRIGDLAHDRRQLRAACDQGVRYGVNRRGIRDGH